MTQPRPEHPNNNNRPPQNRLLQGLPEAELACLLAHSERVLLHAGDSLYEPLRPIRHVSFLETGVCSLVRVPREGIVVENAVIGREGMVGLPVLLGVASTPSRGVVQVPGAGLRLPAARFREEVQPGAVLYERLLRYAQFLMEQMAQGMACNRLHSLEQRCARWLLMTQDRVDNDHFPLTQEFLAQMLGVRRSSVSTVAHEMAQRGLIRYRRGIISIPDRGGLEAVACECYHHVEEEYRRLMEEQSRAEGGAG